MSRNVHGVPKRQWRRWSAKARRVFNELHRLMGDQSLFLPPKAKGLSRMQWDTTRWNAAWLAADLADERSFISK